MLTMTRPWFSPMVLLAVMALAACSDSSSPPNPAPPPPGSGGVPSGRVNQGTVPERVRLGYFANLTHAQAVLGVSSGEFEKAVAPAKFETRIFNAGPSLIEALFANEIDIGYVGPSPALNAFFKTRGQGIRVVGGAASNGVVIIARKDSGIAKLEDLKGKRIATPQLANTQDIAAKHYVTAVLGQKDTDNVVPIPNAEQLGMLTRGDIDAAWAPEPWGTALLEQGGATLIAEEKDLWPEKEFMLTVIVATPEFLQKHPDTVAAILEVSRSWTARLNSEPDKYVPQLGEALFALTSKKLPAGVLPAAIKRVKFSDEPIEGTFQTYAQWSYDLGLSRQEPKIEGLIDRSVLERMKGK
jgi:NitT/TauT family transport system substrate-binding protein